MAALISSSNYGSLTLAVEEDNYDPIGSHLIELRKFYLRLYEYRQALLSEKGSKRKKVDRKQKFSIPKFPKNYPYYQSSRVTSKDSHSLRSGTSRDSHLLRASTLRDSHLLRASTLRDSHLFRASTLRDSHLFRASTSRDSHSLRAGTSRDSHSLRAGTSGDSQSFRAGTSRDSHSFRASTSKDSHSFRGTSKYSHSYRGTSKYSHSYRGTSTDSRKKIIRRKCGPSASDIEKERKKFIINVLKQTGFYATEDDYVIVGYLSDLLHCFLKKISKELVYNKSLQENGKPMAILEKTLQDDVGIDGIYALYSFYNERIVITHDVLYDKCVKLHEEVKMLKDKYPH